MDYAINMTYTSPLSVGDEEPFARDFHGDQPQQHGHAAGQGLNMQAAWEDIIGRKNTHSQEVQTWMERKNMWMEGVDTTIANLTKQIRHTGIPANKTYSVATYQLYQQE